MLARARFETETPNVIDAGEDAPSRPSRRAPSSSGRDISSPFDDHVTADSASPTSVTISEDTRQHMYTASNKGHISKGIRINYSLEADEEPDASPAFEDEYEDSGNASGSYGYPRGSSGAEDGLQLRGQRSAQQPVPKRASSINSQENERSIREARLFAAAMLNESERRINLHNEHNLSLRQESSSSLRQMMTKAVGGGSRRFYDEISLVEEPNIRPHDPRRFRRRMWCRLVAALVVILAVVLFGVFVVDAIRDRNRNSNNSGLPTSPERLDDTISFLFENQISLARDLYDESTPQYQAARWLALEDPEQLTVPAAQTDSGGLRSMNPYRFVQRYVLAVLFYALNGEQWVSPRKFVSGAHECSWFESTVHHDGITYAMGVTCDRTNDMQVRNLLLPNNNLVGSLPPEIQHLSNLDFLDLRNNTITGSLPTELKALSLLNFLDLNENQITGTIPHWLGESLNRLQALGLSDNLLEGSIPESLATGLAPNLKTLSLDGNMLTGDVAPLQRLRYLQYLYLNDNDFVGEIDRGLIADMRFLEQVDLSGNRLGGSIPWHIFRMDKLKVMDLSNNELTGVIPGEAGKNLASPLEFFSLRNNSLSGSIPAEIIQQLTGLYHLDLSFNQFTGDCPDVIGSDLTSLTYLFLGDNSLSLAGGTIPNHLQSLTNLHELSLGNLGLTGPIPIWIETFEHLRLLDLAENQLTGSIDLDFTSLKHLRYLILHDNLLTGRLPDSMDTLENLRVLSLHLNDITDDQTSRAVCDSPRLELMTVDCDEIDCPCCDECCDSDKCFQGVVWESLEHGDGNWEEHFERSDYSFNPHITLKGDIFGGELGCGDECG